MAAAKFKVVEDTDIEGQAYKAGDIVELEADQAEDLLSSGKIEAEKEEAGE